MAQILTEEEQTQQEPLSGINITPLVDVSLVLLLIFMVTTPLSLIHGINVRKQLLEKYGLTTPQENVFVYLTSKEIRVRALDGKMQPVAYEDFGAILSQLIRLSTTKNLLLKVAQTVPHGQTVWVLDLAKQNGARDLTILEDVPL